MTLFFPCQTALHHIMKQNVFRYNAAISDKWKQLVFQSSLSFYILKLNQKTFILLLIWKKTLWNTLKKPDSLILLLLQSRGMLIFIDYILSIDIFYLHIYVYKRIFSLYCIILFLYPSITWTVRKQFYFPYMVQRHCENWVICHKM